MGGVPVMSSYSTGVWGKQEPQPWVYEASTKRVTDHHGRCLTAPTMKDNEALIFSACAPHDPTQMWFYDGTTFTLAATVGTNPNPVCGSVYKDHHAHPIGIFVPRLCYAADRRANISSIP